MEIFMTQKLSFFFLLRSILENISNFMDPLIFSNSLLEKWQNFTEEYWWTGANFYFTNLLYHWPYYLNIHGLIKIPKLEIIVYYIFLIFSNRGISFIGNSVDIYGRYKWCDTIKYEYNLTNKEKFWWLQIIHAIPKLWVEVLNKDLGVSVNLAIYDHNLTKNCQLYTLDKLVSKELDSISLSSMYEKPKSHSCYEKLLETTNLNWKEIYILPRKVSIDTNLRMFQYKILNNILFPNKLLFKFKKFPSPPCSFCNSVDETLLHIFYTCNIKKWSWNELQYSVSQYLYTPEITPQSALLRFFNISNQQQNFLLINHLQLIFMHYQENMEPFVLLVWNCTW